MALGVGMISQLFVLAPNGHTIVHKDYRGDVPKEAPEIFLRKVVEAETSPVFQVDGVNYICVRKNGLFFLCTTVYNVPPAFVIELLTQLTKVCKDYIGVLNEESLRKNFTLIYVRDPLETIARPPMHPDCWRRVGCRDRPCDRRSSSMRSSTSAGRSVLPLRTYRRSSSTKRRPSLLQRRRSSRVCLL